MTDFYKATPKVPMEIWELAGDGEARKLTPEETDALLVADARKHAEHVAAKGHDCWDVENVVHSHDSGTKLGDYYTCGICGDLLQVG